MTKPTPTLGGTARAPVASANGSGIARGKQNLEARAMLALAVAESGLSKTQYAKQILLRNPRSLRRWLAGDSPIPEAVREFLQEAVK